MSFGFGGFGQQNTQGSGFGTGSGFGGTSSGGGFGSTPSFGASSSGSGLFGNNSSSFGSGGGFGAGAQNQSNSMFGGQNRTPGFGASTSSSPFGSSTATAGGGGFGAGSAGSGGFGAGNTGGAFGGSGGGMFGANKTGTGFGGATGTGGFGAGASTPASTGSGFGGGGAGFGGATGTAFNQAVPPSEGTGGTPFSPFTEKDGSSSVTNHYQSISFMQPYSKYSFEELRVADYSQGRRFGNGSGQAGAFGTSAFGSSAGTGFGQQQPSTTGFGSTPSAFGASTSAPSGFGQTTQTAGGFGSTPSNPLFGANKPATSLFGGGSTAAPAQPSGGLFGGGAGATGTTGGFGNTGTTGGFGAGATGGSSLFGGANQQQNKPLFGGGASTGSTGTGLGGFGQQNTGTSSSLFGGGAASSSPFGGGQQQPQPQQTGTTGFGGFGQQNQAQTQAQPQNKGLFGGGGLGAGTQQPSTTPSLFGGGAGTTGSSLFGQNNQQPQQQQQPAAGSSLFGGGANQQSGTSSLFGGGAQPQQPAQKSLFGGGAATGTSTGFGGAFGSTPNQQAGAGGGLFGGTQPQQQQKPSLFGGSTGTGGSLFGGSSAPAQNTGSSLFGNQSQPAQAGGGLGTSSLFGNTQAQPQQAQQPQQPAPGSLQASILDANPYGNQSIFSGLPAPSAQSPGPLATPLSSTNKQKQRTPLPVHKITPSAANRLITPPKRQGYGFSYSTYGSPSSNASTPNGLGSGLLAANSMRGSLGGSMGRGSFSKSFSTSNLRKTFDPETDSVLSPGALSSGPSRLPSGNLKRLTIDRSLRNDLFSRPASTSTAPITNGDESIAPGDKMKKKVSFEAPSPSDTASDSEIVPIQASSSEPTPEELGFLRSIRKSGTINGISNINGAKQTPDSVIRPDIEPLRTDLASVPEDAEQAASADGPTRLAFIPSGDPKPGDYWMKPSRAEIAKMPRDQQKRMVGLTVGRERCGQVTFDEPVDLTTIDLDQIFGGLVEIGVRKITVYPDESMKPQRGKGLNVPSTLRIENSWPRGRDKKAPSPVTSGPLFDKHIDRLRKVHNAEFVDYEMEKGTWVFRVPHFTTYGLDYDSDEDEEGEGLDQSTLSAAPDTPTPKAQSPFANTVGSEQTTFSTDDSFVGSIAGVEDDTFDFKKRKLVPGAFGNQAMEVMADERSFSEEGTESFLGDGSTGSTTEQDGDDDVTESQQSGDSEVELDDGEEMEMAGTFPDLRPTVERDDITNSADSFYEHSQPSLKPWNTPPKTRLDLTGDWAEHLQRTISPRKQDRAALREIQANAFNDRPLQDDTPKGSDADARQQKGFATSIDLMNSLFQQPRKQTAPSPLKPPSAGPKGFEWPYNKRPKTYAGESNELSGDDLAFHHSFKPRWGPVDSMICVKSGWGGVQSGDDRWKSKLSVTSEEREIVLLEFHPRGDVNTMIDVQRQQSAIRRVDGVPLARLTSPNFQQFAQAAATQPDQERLIWQLANVLFNDDIEDDISAAVPPQVRPKFLPRIKKDRLSRLLEGIIREKHARVLGKAGSAEEQAVYLLCSHRVDEACNVLMTSQNLHLATLVAQIGRDRTTRADMAQQVEMWRQHNVSSEMTEPMRALYELLAGNALRSEGKSGGALEDRSSSFSITERFELDWFEAFGLRLWYSITEDEPIEAAVSSYMQDLTSGEETAFPYPPNQTRAGRESPLWVLLKLYAGTIGAAPGLPVQEFPAALMPECVGGDALSSGLSFPLYHLLSATVGPHDRFLVNPEQADRLVRDFAWELSCAGELQRAVFVLLHLSRPMDRERGVRELLARFAPRLPEPVTTAGISDSAWDGLTKELHVPEAWLWEAKALSARDQGDAAGEVDYLVRAKNWTDAHATFCRIVGPTAVIEQDYATLERLISGFGDGPESQVPGWARGGGVYEDFLRLVTARGGARERSRLHRLVQALGAMAERMQGTGVEGLEERVAFKEMSRLVAQWTAHDETAADLSSAVLRLPLTGDARLVQTAEMSRRYFGAIMAGAY